MKNFIIFIFILFGAYLAAHRVNEKLEKLTPGSSLEGFKKMRVEGMAVAARNASPDYDVLVFGDSFLEILFEPMEFDKDFSHNGQRIRSWNLALRSMSVADFHKVTSHFRDHQARFESCVIQIPALHFSKPQREDVLVGLWPGRGLSDYLNLWNPLSRQDHGFDSPANLWTGQISQMTNPWSDERRGGLNVAESPLLPELRAVLANPHYRLILNQAYNRIMGLSEYAVDSSSIEAFVSDVEMLKKNCEKRYLLWPLFSPDLSDRKIGPDPKVLDKLRSELEEKLKLPIHHMPWNPREIKFLDSQHIDPSFRGDFHKWLAEVI